MEKLREPKSLGLKCQSYGAKVAFVGADTMESSERTISDHQQARYLLREGDTIIQVGLVVSSRLLSYYMVRW